MVDIKAIKDVVGQAAKQGNAKGAELLLPTSFFATSFSADSPQRTQAVGRGSVSHLWQRLLLGGGSVPTAVANRVLDAILSPLDWLMGGHQLIAAEQRAVAIEQKKRAQAARSSMYELSRQIQRAQANAARSIYYSSIADEAARFRALKKEWRDPDFPPAKTSLVSGAPKNATAQAYSTYAGAADVSWMQPRFLLGRSGGKRGSGKSGTTEAGAWFVKDWGVWNGSGGAGFAQGRVLAGMEVDQYVSTCVMALLQDDPSLCDDIMDFTFVSQGIVGVALHVDETLRMIYVDTHFPTCASLVLREAWPAAVEKALAKVHGCYMNISGTAGICLCASAICGNDVDVEELVPLRSRSSASSEGDGGLWKRLSGAAGQECVLAGSRSRFEGGAQQELHGITPGSTYHVLGAVHVGQDRLVRLASPVIIGEGGRTGVWQGQCAATKGGQDLRWEEPSALGALIESGNSFWMPYETFYSLFDLIVFAQRRKGGGAWGNRAELLSLFGSRLDCLVPGLGKRRAYLLEVKEAEAVSRELLKTEEKKKRVASKRKASAKKK